MAEAIATTYEEWKENRQLSFRIGGINARVRLVSNKLLDELPPNLNDEVNAIEGAPEEASRRLLANRMRKLLQVILPEVLISPEWLMQALDDFTDDEIYRLYVIVMQSRVRD